MQPYQHPHDDETLSTAKGCVVPKVSTGRFAYRKQLDQPTRPKLLQAVKAFKPLGRGFQKSQVQPMSRIRRGQGL